MSAAPGLMTLVESYFQAWNSRDPDAVAAVFAPGGTYTDPTVTGPPLSASELAGQVQALLTGFPDLSFEVLSAQRMDGGTAGSTAVARWLMRGTNTGPLGGSPPSGRPVALRGVDVITATDGKIGTVEGYFDRQSLAEQLGLQVIVQPHTAGPFELGRSLRAEGSRKMPGAVSLTWIDGRSAEETDQIQAISRLLAAKLAKTPGCIGWLGCGIGNRLYTITAWEDAATARQVMHDSILHASAIKRFFTKDFTAAVGTGLFTVDHLDALWMRCTTCSEVTNRTKNDACPNGHPLPKPAYW